MAKMCIDGTPLLRPALTDGTDQPPAQVKIGFTQSPWSFPLPSPPSPTFRWSTWPPVTGTSIVTGNDVPLSTGVVVSTVPSTLTLNVTVPGSPLSTPTVAVK